MESDPQFYSITINNPRALLQEIFGADQPGICRTCKGPVTEFKDELSAREFGISHMCQACQDEAFAPFDEEDDGFSDDDHYSDEQIIKNP